MKEIKQIIFVLFFVISINFLAKGQCHNHNRVYNCVARLGKAIYLRDFNTKLHPTNNGKENGTKWTVVLNKGTHYRFGLCTHDDIKDKVVLTLYDSKNPEFVSPLGMTHTNEYGESFDFICQRSGIYYVSIRWKPCVKNYKKSCAVGILGFVGRYDKSKIKRPNVPLVQKEFAVLTLSSDTVKIRNRLDDYQKNQLKNLKIVTEKKNNIPNFLADYKQIEEIHITCNNCFNYIQADSVFRKLPKLKSIHIRVAAHNLLNDYLKTFNYFEELNLSNSYLSHIPESMFSMKKLRKINLSENNFRKIKNTTAFNVEEADLSFNALIEIPKFSKKIIKLNIKGNFIEYDDIITFIKKHKNLKEINIVDNRLAEREKRKLINEIKIFSEPLTLYEINPKDDFSKVRKYTDMKIAHKEPDIVYKLDLSQQSISLDKIEEFKNLRYLNLIFCRLKTIPSEIYNLKKLEEVNLSSNNFSNEEKEKIKQEFKKYLPNCRLYI